MGTHMWTNASARRGRRMSFEMPPNFPPPPNHFMHARPEMFHPYINSAAMFQQKVSELPSAAVSRVSESFFSVEKKNTKYKNISFSFTRSTHCRNIQIYRIFVNFCNHKMAQQRQMVWQIWRHINRMSQH